MTATQTAGPVALTQVVVIKLMRVALLAPVATGVAVMRRRPHAAGRTGND